MERLRQRFTIMFTDIEGYTAIMQRSEAEGLCLRDRHRSVFESSMQRHGGRIIQYFGDGTLSVFLRADRALRSAIELQQAFRRQPAVPVRIGLHCGEIVLEPNDIIGDAVNIASRVEATALPGSVLLTETVAAELSPADDFHLAPLGSFQFKNDQYARELFALRAPDLYAPSRRALLLRQENVPLARADHSWWSMMQVASSLFGRALTQGAEHLFLPIARKRVSSIRRSSA